MFCVTNSVNKRHRDSSRWAKSVLLVALVYKNPKLKKKKKKKKKRAVVYGRAYVVPYGSRVAYGPSVTHMLAAHS